ncbi:MAG: hypothetical protein AAF206_28075 [Bacteroidota bacterium]
MNQLPFIQSILGCICLIFLSSCAGNYASIGPEHIPYASSATQGEVKMEYKYNLLKGKYAKKEANKGIRLVAVKIHNGSSRELEVGQDIRLIYENGRELQVVGPETTFQSLRQGVAPYLLYLLLTPLQLNVSTGNDTNTTRIGLVIGPALTLGNAGLAGSANSLFKRELDEHQIYGITIQPGETRHGLVAIRSDSYEALTIVVKEN